VAGRDERGRRSGGTGALSGCADPGNQRSFCRTGRGRGAAQVDAGGVGAVATRQLESAAREARVDAGAIPVHLEIDTGMSRQGVDPGSIDPLLARFRNGLAVEA